ncbi:MAG: DoxX family protein [Proteobacteria bacterium]|nr:DoxX family protein [Pseudomonadota bacterium]
MSPRPKSLDLGLLTLRLGVGGFMLYGHGWGKLQKLLDGGSSKFPDPLGIGPELSFACAALGESVAAIAIMVGLLSRLSTAALGFTMAVAGLVVHAGDPFGDREKALLYLMGCAVLLLTGPGKFTLQRKLFKEPSNPKLRWLLS